MQRSTVGSGIRLARILIWGGLWAAAATVSFGQVRTANDGRAESTLVRVDITLKRLGDPEPVEIAGRKFSDYRPQVIETFPSTGVVFDAAGNILTFLGYSWVDCQGPDPIIDVTTASGRRFRGMMVGIDQSIGVAVVRGSEQEHLARTPFCLRCDVKGGATVVFTEPAKFSQFYQAQILSVDHRNQPVGGYESWIVTVDRPLPGIGAPILDSTRRVLGFVAGQSPLPNDPNATETVVYPIAQLLSSAEKVLRAGGDIRTGWFGVYLVDLQKSGNPGVMIKGVQEDSPAEKAGLRANDFLARWNGNEIRDASHFIQMVQDTSIGSTARVEFVRDGRPMIVETLIEARKPQKSGSRVAFDLTRMVHIAQAEMSQTARALQTHLDGLDFVALTPQLAEFLQIPGQTGLLVASVEPDAPFGLAGVLAGDIITAIDGQSVAEPSLLSARVQALSGGGTLSVKLLRKGTEQSATIQLPASNPKP
jgi:serine protease Do